MPLPSRSRALHQERSSVVEESHPQSLHRPLSSPQLEARGSPPDLNSATLSRHYAQMAQALQSSLPPACHQLTPEDVNLVCEHPIAAGGFANIYGATHDGRKVVLKSYRCYTSFDVAEVVARFRSEVHVVTLLHHRGVDVVPLVGVYSTGTHPFGLVYEYMDGLDLRQYLRNNPDVGTLKLLTRIARTINRMHGLGVVHGRLQTANVLVDKYGTPRIVGLGNASILPRPTVRAVEGGTGADRVPRSRVPGLTRPVESTNLTDLTHPTKASDMYAFGVMAWEVLTGRLPFFEMTEIAATYSMLTGVRPPRPHHHEVSDRVWDMIDRCWHNVPSERLSAGEAVNLLEAELGRA